MPPLCGWGGAVKYSEMYNEFKRLPVPFVCGWVQRRHSRRVQGRIAQGRSRGDAKAGFREGESNDFEDAQAGFAQMPACIQDASKKFSDKNRAHQQRSEKNNKQRTRKKVSLLRFHKIRSLKLIHYLRHATAPHPPKGSEAREKVIVAVARLIGEPWPLIL
ncbi:hypothetical protein T492DRAFT_921597 [Pavlovales sp. CCMP2436]|nr:hypothetical protein T492DRAFT_921597 [Pavlovales sp. CCMP2436]